VASLREAQEPLPAVVREHADELFIAGRWVVPSSSSTLEVIDPATERPLARIADADAGDVDHAVAAAARGFEAYGVSTREERLELLERIAECYAARADELASVITRELGAPSELARAAHAPLGLRHLMAAIAALRTIALEERLGDTTVVHEPIGVCGLITPWNWPLNQILAKIAPALAAGCAVVLKPSELAPLNAIVLADIIDQAGVPAGVFNLVNGCGPTAGAALAAHQGVDMVSFTGSTRAGVEIARLAAPTVKRVTQELGGKSANILLDDADLDTVLPRDLARVFLNSGQSCNACTRVLVPEDLMDDAVRIARRVAEATTVGPPEDTATQVGPVISEAQRARIEALMAEAISGGATVVAGGPGRPSQLKRGFFVRPTVLTGVTGEMRIYHEEIFGPVVTLIGYEDEQSAIRIANDTRYGLSGMVSSADPARARRVARRLRTGMVHVNGAPISAEAPFGGHGMSGNGREYGIYGIREFLETKSIYGAPDADARRV
jgi:aldehyde dehydrogenase (NAD+)